MDAVRPCLLQEAKAAGELPVHQGQGRGAVLRRLEGDLPARRAVVAGRNLRIAEVRPHARVLRQVRPRGGPLPRLFGGGRRPGRVPQSPEHGLDYGRAPPRLAAARPRAVVGPVCYPYRTEIPKWRCCWRILPRASRSPSRPDIGPRRSGFCSDLPHRSISSTASIMRRPHIGGSADKLRPTARSIPLDGSGSGPYRMSLRRQRDDLTRQVGRPEVGALPSVEDAPLCHRGGPPAVPPPIPTAAASLTRDGPAGARRPLRRPASARAERRFRARGHRADRGAQPAGVASGLQDAEDEHRRSRVVLREADGRQLRVA